MRSLRIPADFGMQIRKRSWIKTDSEETWDMLKKPIKKFYKELEVVWVYKATVYVTLRESVLDPQGSAVQQSLHSLGYGEVGEVRIGKYMELEINSQDQKMAEQRVKDMCEKLLANTVIEDYRFEVTTG